MSEWQPIETAPKDGSYVILCNESGAWIGAYKEVFVSGFKPQNPWISMMLNHRHIPYGASHIPKHWMSLPEPPKGK